MLLLPLFAQPVSHFTFANKNDQDDEDADDRPTAPSSAAAPIREIFGVI
jgi:hypothetical protein